jgi:hypothetical protein
MRPAIEAAAARTRRIKNEGVAGLMVDLLETPRSGWSGAATPSWLRRWTMRALARMLFPLRSRRMAYAALRSRLLA